MGKYCSDCGNTIDDFANHDCKTAKVSNSRLIDGVNALINAWQEKEKTTLDIANNKGYDFSRGRAVQLNENAEQLRELIKGT